MEKKLTIPLRKAFLKVPIHQRTKKAVKALNEFVFKHLKVDDVKIGKYLNLKMWEKGNRNPPHKVEVVAEIITEKKKGKEIKIARIELVGAPKEKKKETKKKKLVERLKEKVSPKEQKEMKDLKEIADEQKEEKKEAQKVIMKEEEKILEAQKAPKFTKGNMEDRKSHDQKGASSIMRKNLSEHKR